jgi:hypothetical protein
MTDWLKMNVRRFQFSTDAEKRDFPFFLTLSLFPAQMKYFRLSSQCCQMIPILVKFGEPWNGKCCYIYDHL